MDPDEVELAMEAPIPTLVSGGGISITPLSTKKDTLGLNNILRSAGIGQPITKKRPLKAVKLSEITKPFSKHDREHHIFTAVKRILNSKRTLTEAKCEVVCSIVTTSGIELRFCKEFWNYSLI